MDVSPKENLPPPPGIINSIKTGFDLVAGNVTAIWLPLFLNLFIWLGPRLQMDALFNSIKNNVVSMWQAFGIPAVEIQQMIGWYDSMLPYVNLFSLAFTAPVGISNFFANANILHLVFPGSSGKVIAEPMEQTPYGNPPILQVTEWNILGLVILLVVTGWVVGGLYFRAVAWLARTENDSHPIPIPHAVLQTILMSISWGAISVFAGIPFLTFLTIVTRLSNSFISSLVVLFLGLASMWLIVPLYFWSHGIFLKQQNVLSSILSSFQLARFTLPTSSLFVLTVFLLTLGLAFLWSIPPVNSWMMLVGMLGHSFIATALLASSFVYYRDMTAWLQSAIERLKLNPPRLA